ncbi:hypothetical protein [Citreimonas salinaria]|uniref:EF hand n=1 Tax=Citreimonas salinaria TaxID=321339 RepID=A0A1H3NUF9_9RHOB|nr:hypothetical protein [Citreimonas salinaria]SDY92581.1 hypothetical protein SAMN05444340_13210 [Citreimonas salinaria]
MKLADTFSVRTAALVTTLMIPVGAFAQAAEWTYTDWDNDGNLELSETEFQTGFAESGTFDAWDRDDDTFLSEGEFATGTFADWDTDNDLQITEEEYTVGAERWYGPDYNTPYTDWDADESGYIDRTEFGEGWDSDYYTAWDEDEDSLLSEDEYTAGVYDSADLNDDYVVTVEEEGWFEGWFDGDDVEAEIEEVGDVY